MSANDYIKQKERALTRKLEIIESKGGKCEICGYDKNISALEFHHLIPTEKNFQLDSRHLSNTTMGKILEEAEKCILVCSNCHKELHHPSLDKDNIAKLLEEIKSEHIQLKRLPQKAICQQCGKEFDYSKGKKYCCKKCRDIAFGRDKYPSYEEIISKYNELNSWTKVANFFGVTRKVIRRIRKINGTGL